MSLFMTVMISPFSHTIVYIVFGFSPFYLVVHHWQTFSWFMQNPLLNFLGGWIKSSLRTNTAVFGCPALKMFAPLLPGSVVSVLGGMCIHMCTNPAKCNHQDTSSANMGMMATQAQPKLLLLLNLLHV